MLPPRDPSTPPFRIAVRAPPAARQRISRKRGGRKRVTAPPAARPRKTVKLPWASIMFWLTILPITTALAEQLVHRHDPALHILAALWVTLMDGIIYLAAILIFRPAKPD